MPDPDPIQQRQRELAVREWNVSAIEERFSGLVAGGITPKKLDREIILRDKEAILDRVQCRAEDYCYLMRNCAKSSAAALLEEFGLGNLEIIRALGPFPGIAMSGGICGPVTGGLVALGLFFPAPISPNMT